MTKATCSFVTFSWIIVYPANEDDKVDGEMRYGAGIPIKIAKSFWINRIKKIFALLGIPQHI